jgi:hypothetical protein
MIDRVTKKFSVVEMTWWVDTRALRDHDVLDRVLDIMERVLPEAIAKRYGFFEPPEFRLAEEGVQHFRTFVKDTIDESDVVFYPHPPLASLFLTSSFDPGGTDLGYRANVLKLSIESSALAQPKWATRVRTFWREVSETIRPFFGDVRTLGGFERHGGTIYGGESHPITGAAWDGVPTLEGAHAVVVGEPLLERWPEFRAIAEVHEGLAFLSSDAWQPGSTLTIERVPLEIARVPEGTLREAFRYPSRFPFETRPADGGPSFASGSARLEYMQRLKREAAKPMIDELHEAGFAIDSVWDFVGTKPPQNAIRILLEHLRRSYPPGVRYDICFALRKANFTRAQVEELVAIFTEASAKDEGADIKSAYFLSELARALCRNFKRRDFDRMLTFIRDPKCNASRWAFVDSFARKFRAEAVPVLVELLDERDAQFAALSALKAMRDPSGIAFAESVVANRRLRSYADSLSRQLASEYLKLFAQRNRTES